MTASSHAPLSNTAVDRRAPFNALLPPDKVWFTPREAAGILGRTDQYVRDCFLNQKILGHTSNGRAPRHREQRKRYAIHRDALLLYLCETANYTPDDWLDRLCDLLATTSHEQRRILIDCLNQPPEKHRPPRWLR